MSIIFPSTTTWITARSTVGQITTNNSIIILPQKIEKIERIVINLPNLKMQFENPTRAPKLHEIYLDENYTQSLSELDITHYVVEKEKYDTLITYNAATMPGCFGPQYTNNTWYYEHNGNNIVLPNNIVKGNIEVSGSPITAYVISSAVYNYIYNNGKKDGKLYIHFDDNPDLDTVVTYSDNLDISISNSVSNTPDIRNIPFRIYYTPLGESVKLQVPKTNPQPNKFCIPYSQQQPIVDNVTHGREMQSIANRTGCEKREVVRTLRGAHAAAGLRKNGVIWREKDESGNLTGNVWRLTGQRIQIYSETLIRVIETWSKNWSYRSENVPINREFRSWNIPADIVQRNLLRQDYCLITRKAGVSLLDDSSLSEDAKAYLMRGLMGVNYGNSTECTNMWFYTKDGNNLKGAVISCSAFGFGNSLVFSGKTKDNLSAGVQRVKSDNNDSNYQFCKDVYYCNDDGTLETLWVQIGSELFSDASLAEPNLASNLYPEFYSNQEQGTQNGFGTADGLYLFKTDTSFKVRKDPCEQLNLTYQLHLLTDDGYLIIGSTWAATNPLVKQRDTAQAIKVWKLTQRLPQGAQVMTSVYGTVTQSNLFSVVDSGDDGQSVTFNTAANDGVGVCVTDAQNNILIAFNSTDPATFRVLFTHDYKAIARALKAS